MAPERGLGLGNFIEVARNKPDQFSRGCDSLVDYQFSPKTITDVTQFLRDGKNMVLVTNHQSYFEIETLRHFCDLINQSLQGELQAFLLYSAPAVASNIGTLLQLRNETYLSSGLNLLGVIRDSDRVHPVYKYSINEEMEKQDRQSRRTNAKAISGRGNLIISPFEATLKGGRVDLETGKINGMQPSDENCLEPFIKRNFLLLPCGIDGSYHLINPKTHLPSNELIQAITIAPSKNKIVTFNVGDIIDPTPRQLDSKKIIIKVAQLLSHDAQGYYSQYV